MICNASPLICLSRANRLQLLREVFKTITLPEAVLKEVLVEGKPGVPVLKEALKENWIKVEKPREILSLDLGKGETAAISLAKEKKEKLLIDDFQAIKAAEFYEIPVLRTTTVLFLAVNKRILSKEEALSILNKLIEEGYYISPQYYVKIWDELHNQNL